MNDVLKSISTIIITGKKDEIGKLTQEALDKGLSAQDILYKGLMPGMDHVSKEFKKGDMFVPEVMRSARTMLNSMEILKPLLSESGVKMVGESAAGNGQRRSARYREKLGGYDVRGCRIRNQGSWR